jgi:glycosyltransferase involved in cell wall biosynthesis
MRILLSYSRNHFDPSLPQKQQENWGSSASILARTLYRLLCDLGEVRYIDLTEVDLVRGDEFDLFVGVITNFTLIRSACRIRRSVLFAVNMHPLERTSILRRRISTTTPSDVRAEILNETHHYRWAASAIKEADAIICVGNAVTLKSYFERGVPLKKIKVINYGVGPCSSLEPRRPKPPVRRLLYVSSDIGLRKGFDIIEAAIRSIVSEGIPFHLDILGKALCPSYQDRVQKLVELKPEAIRFHGWINSSTTSYDEIVSSCDYILAPSLEEGQLGAMLDALRLCVVPISSAYTGIDFSPLGVLSPDPNDPHNVVLLKSALQKSDDEIDALKAHALDYYQLFHEPFEINLKSTLIDAFSGGASSED